MVVAAPLVYGRIVIDMATMINEDNLFKTLRRTFANALSEMLGEVLQNSQRAGATRVEIATSAGKEQSIVTIEDDGRGIADWRALLVVAQSDFDRAVMEDQAPMGVGFGSVLAYDGIASVGIASGGRSLHIETGRWWEDRAYREGWEGRLEAVDMPTGTRLRACPQTLHAQKVLFPNQQGHNRWFPGYREDAHTAIVPSRAFGDCARASAARRATAGGRRIASFLATTDLVVGQKVRWKGRGFVDTLLPLPGRRAWLARSRGRSSPTATIRRRPSRAATRASSR